MNQPTPQEVSEFVKQDIFKWFLEKVALRLNELDTVRDADILLPNEMYSRRLAIETIESIFSDLVESKQIKEVQREVASKESSTIKILKENKEDLSEKKENDY